MRKLKVFIEQSWLLIVASFCFGLLIATTNAALSERIEKNQTEKLNGLMQSLVVDADSFKKVIEGDIDIYQAKDKTGKVAGYAFIGIGSGFADKIKLVIAVDGSCEKFFGFKVLSSNETPGFGSKIKENFLGDQFKGAPAGVFDLEKAGDPSAIDSQIVAISGATVSSTAVVKIFNSYIEQVKSLLQEKGFIGDGK